MLGETDTVAFNGDAERYTFIFIHGQHTTRVSPELFGVVSERRLRGDERPIINRQDTPIAAV